MGDPSTAGAPSAAAFRGVMSRFATGVSVMTTVRDGEPHGMTANAVTSVSLQPLLVLVSVERGTVMAERVAASRVFALSFLAAGQDAHSDRFADSARPAGAAQFAGVDTVTAVTGCPLLTGALAWLDCRVWAIHDGGDHLLVLGEPAALDEGDDGVQPLVFYRGAYRELD